MSGVPSSRASAPINFIFRSHRAIMRYGRILMSAALLLAVAACGDDAGVTPGGAPDPAALARIINVGTDWGTVDFSFVDRVENLPTFKGVAFRGNSGVYQRIDPPGQRMARLFPFSTNLDTTRIDLLGDLNLNLAANGRYTLIYAGRADAGAPEAERHRLVVLEDPAALPTPTGNNVAIKVLHAVPGVAAVDVYMVPVDSAGAPLPADWQASPRVAVGGFLQQSAYVNVPARNVPRAAGTANQQYRFVVTAAGAATPLITTNPGILGSPAPIAGQIGFGTVGPQPGVQIPGSVLTAVVSPGHTENARGGTTAALRTPAVFLVVDKPLNVQPAQ
jgi:hypothetical protein